MDLSEATAESFEPLKGESFAVRDSDLSLELVDVTLMTSAESSSERSPFALTFKGRFADVPAQGLYGLNHATAGALEIFLVPVGREDEDYLLEAVFN